MQAKSIIPGISRDDVLHALFPFPSLAEQKRIVAKVDELMSMCDEFETTAKQLNDLDKNFADYLSKSILQSAVQGKLVPQNPHDEPATELLKRIEKEKARLIKEGKIKKEKPLPPIADDEIPYDLPDGWVWCRLGEIVIPIMGQSPDGDSVSDNHSSTDNIEFHQGKTYFTDKFLAVSDKATTSSTKIAEGGDVLLSVRAPVGAVNITQRRICVGRGLCALRGMGNMSSDFLLYFVKTLENYFNSIATGTTFLAISGEVIYKTLFPLPPLAEQGRIVAKVDELMGMCEELRSKK